MENWVCIGTKNQVLYPNVSCRHVMCSSAEKPSLQSRHSLDSSRVQEKEAGPLWITLALQKQKGFREQQQNREERRSQREAKLAEKNARDSVRALDDLFTNLRIHFVAFFLSYSHNHLLRLLWWAPQRAKEAAAPARLLNLRRRRSRRDPTASWDDLSAEKTWKNPTPYRALSPVRTRTWRIYIKIQKKT